MFIVHIHSYFNIVKKTLHHTINSTLTKNELFAIRYRINQAIQVLDVSHIIVITDDIHTVQYIFDFTVYLY